MKQLEYSRTADSDVADVICRLRCEFDRLNEIHFDGGLMLPQIVLSRRKTFGGYYRPSEHKIVLSWQAYLEHGWDETVNTFRHEVAHMVHFNHSRAFWDLASQLGCTRRYAAAPVRRRKRRRYIYACPCCGQRVIRYRRLRHASCGVCDKSYNPLFLLRPVGEELN